MRARSSVSRPVPVALAAMLAGSLGAASLARAELGRPEAPSAAAPSSAQPSEPAVRSAAIQPVAPASTEPVPATAQGAEEPDALPATSDTPAPSDFREAPTEEQPATAAPADPAQPKDALGEAILSRLNDRKPLLARLLPKDGAAMLTYYTVVDFKPIWIADRAFTPEAKSVIARLRAAGEDGLDPGAYPVPTLGGLGRPETDEEIAQAELKLSAAAVLYARDARGGRINPSAIAKLITPRIDLPEADIVLGQLSLSGDKAGDALQTYNPNQPGYLALKSRLNAGAAPASQTAHTPLRLPVGPVLRVGMSDPRVPMLRAHFGLPERKAGTLDAAPGEPDLYDGDLSDAVAKFQRGRDLPDNGNLTRSTLVALALSDSPRMRSGNEAELIANMERWRWLPRELGDDYVLVNVPEYRLRVYRGGALRDETRVIVGKTESPTPIFSGAMEYAVVNPSWYVPPSILKTMRGTGGFEVIGRGKTYGLRQPPGPRNALGYIKFLFPNQHSVYLHDTPARHLFSSAKRALSHGCVRVDDPFRFADAVLPDTWTAESLKKLIGKGERTIRLTEKLPVHIAYFTAYIDDGGTYRTLPDLYGYDAPIKAALGLSSQGGAMVAALPSEPKREAASLEMPAAAAQARSSSARPIRREAMQAAPRPRRYVPNYRYGYGYGEVSPWGPVPSQPRTWW